MPHVGHFMMMTDPVGELSGIPAAHRAWREGMEATVPGSCEGEVICGIPSDCLLYTQNNGATFSQNSVPEPNINVVTQPDIEVVQYEFPDQGFLDIQEEEVVCETWGDVVVPTEESDNVDEVKFSYTLKYETEDVEIPLPQDQDSYLAARPYPCDFCSRRFRKKANLMNHMVAHQTDRPHGCNMCGARYRRKCDLINHMKIHAYAPGRDVLTDEEEEEAEEEDDDEGEEEEVDEEEEDDEDEEEDDVHEEEVEIEVDNESEWVGRMSYSQNEGTARSRRKKNQMRKRKNNHVNRGNRGRTLSGKGLKQRNYNSYSGRRKYANENSVNISAHSYVEEDVKLLKQNVSSYSLDSTQQSENEDQDPPAPRWPVVDETRPYVCQHCGVGFAREKALGSHVRIHAGDSPFECNTCGEMFWDVNLLRDHSKAKHPGKYEASSAFVERYSEFRCDVCGLKFQRQDLLRRHQRLHIKDEQSYDEGFHHCEECGQNFNSRTDMLTHMETHGRYQPHRCMLCGECFADSASVATHVKRRHARTIPPNACTLCGKTCRDRRSLQKHSWVHSAERSFACQKCSKRFHSRSRLKRHMVSHRDKAVACEECGEEFPDGRALINHRHSHNRDSSGRQFACLQCGKTFGSRSSQQIHARIHTGERPYGCRYCWKAFADGGTLRKHERIHTGEKPYACPICPRAFNQRVVLREHIRSHHSGPEMMPSSSSGPHFVCKVCAASFDCSEDLCAHLIKHSDENTAKHRLPKLGPRKYKRRRKFSVHEFNLFSFGSDRMDSVDKSEDDSDDVKHKIIKRKYKIKPKSGSGTTASDVGTHTANNLQSVADNLDSVVQNFNSIVTSDMKSDTSKRLSKSKGKCSGVNSTKTDSANAKSGISSSVSGGFLKSTRPAGEARPRPRTKNVNLSTLAALKAVSLKAAGDSAVSKTPESMKGRPRTKNVSYHNVKMAKLEVARFPNATKADASCEKVVRNNLKTTNDIKEPKQSIFELVSNAGMLSDSDEDGDMKVEYTCEMCSETFTKRSELLVHVPIHI
ncbi:zinc finger protein 16 isoform X2 [Schistocerca cancellata]|uniref:zinc finger protein 16 isoform X2 n=1 Tax=Schistocerca cancellata TaxID=274614 RepID=UPI0021178BF8|nr:zinc finger protein 16 isoform X2 [Schistocerca cancellata]